MEGTTLTEPLISTHAPAGGATEFFDADFQICCHISTHAPAGGATLRAVLKSVTKYTISTHAPAGGATCSLNHLYLPQVDFYSRPCGRGDSY